MPYEAYERVGPLYLSYYTSQRGRGDAIAGPRVFRGAERWRPRQRGDGFGSMLRGLARFILPVLGRGIGTFATHTLDATDRGVSLGDAAKSALKPTLRAVVDAGVGQLTSSSSQNGNGDGKRRRLVDSSGPGFYERMMEAQRRKRSKKKKRGEGDKKKAKKQHGEGIKKKKKKQRGGGSKKPRKRKQRGGGSEKPRKKKQSGEGKKKKRRVYKRPTDGLNF